MAAPKRGKRLLQLLSPHHAILRQFCIIGPRTTSQPRKLREEPVGISELPRINMALHDLLGSRMWSAADRSRNTSRHSEGKRQSWGEGIKVRVRLQRFIHHMRNEAAASITWSTSF